MALLKSFGGENTAARSIYFENLRIESLQMDNFVKRSQINVKSTYINRVQHNINIDQHKTTQNRHRINIKSTSIKICSFSSSTR